jgi:hypothetical protein
VRGTLVAVLSLLLSRDALATACNAPAWPPAAMLAANSAFSFGTLVTLIGTGVSRNRARLHGQPTPAPRAWAVSATLNASLAGALTAVDGFVLFTQYGDCPGADPGDAFTSGRIAVVALLATPSLIALPALWPSSDEADAPMVDLAPVAVPARRGQSMPGMVLRVVF